MRTVMAAVEVINPIALADCFAISCAAGDEG
jgi:hypothetical protein